MKSEEDGEDPLLSETTDGQLFALMARRDEDGRKACGELHRRYITDFHKLVCKRIDLSDADADELVQETMIQAYQRAVTFEARDDLDQNESRGRTLLWLMRIAQNLYYGERRKQKVKFLNAPKMSASDENSSLSSYEEQKISYAELHHRIREAEDAVSGNTQVGERTVSPERQLLRDALSALKERERDVLQVSEEYYQPGEKNPHLPKEVIAELCERHQIKPDHIRKIRERARKQVSDYLQANTPQNRRGRSHEG